MADFNFIMKYLCEGMFFALIGIGCFFGVSAFLIHYMEEDHSREEEVAFLIGGLTTVLYFIFICWVFG